MEPCRPPERKRHAQLRHQPRGRPLWVGDPDDWAMVRREPRPPLVCPEPGCDVELISYENLHNRHNPRIFKFKYAAGSCDHWGDRGQGGGPESPQHEWIKMRLCRIARDLGYTATPEHPPTESDVFVHEPALCLEVQLRKTEFGKRTVARQAKGTDVCWLIREGLDTPMALRALFRMGGVRFRIIDKDSPGRLLAPWDYPDDRDQARRARLRVFGTIAHAPRPNQQPDAADSASWFHTAPLDGYQFMKEVLAGQRRWYPRNTLSRKSGVWALETDVTAYRAFQEHQHELAQQVDVSRAESTPLPAPGIAEQTEPAPSTALLPIVRQLPQPHTPAAHADKEKITTPPRPRRRWWLFWRRR